MFRYNFRSQWIPEAPWVHHVFFSSPGAPETFGDLRSSVLHPHVPWDAVPTPTTGRMAQRPRTFASKGCPSNGNLSRTNGNIVGIYWGYISHYFTSLIWYLGMSKKFSIENCQVHEGTCGICPGDRSEATSLPPQHWDKLARWRSRPWRRQDDAENSALHGHENHKIPGNFLALCQLKLHHTVW